MMPLTTACPRAPRPTRAKAHGFVLIEVLVSLTILAVGIMAVLTGVLSTLRLQKDTAMRFRAGLIMQDKLAEAFFVSYDGQRWTGTSADGLFNWTIAGEPWADMPQIVTEDSKPGATRPDGDTACEIFLVAIDVSWQTTRGTRRLTATQLVQVPAGAGEAP
jgi:prepilin-type N-terminal cleavage/methylation domain-containing protein